MLLTQSYRLLFILLSLVISSEAQSQETHCKELLKSSYFKQNGTLEYIERLPTPNHQHNPIVIALHGLGHHKEGFAQLAQKLPKSWRIFFVDATFEYNRGHAWYRFRCPQAESDLKLSMQALEKTVQQILRAYPKAPKPALFGFSQGGVMTMAMINDYPNIWSSAADFSGYWLSRTPPKKQPSTLNIPLLIVHGEQDRVVSFNRGLEAARLMGEAGMIISWLPFAGGHHIPRIGLEQLKEHFEVSWKEIRK